MGLNPTLRLQCYWTMLILCGSGQARTCPIPLTNITYRLHDVYLARQWLSLECGAVSHRVATLVPGALAPPAGVTASNTAGVLLAGTPAAPAALATGESVIKCPSPLNVL